jgi:hypothetical protein
MIVRLERDRSAHEIRGVRVVAALMGNQAEMVKAWRMIGLQREDPQMRRLGFGPAMVPQMFDGRCELMIDKAPAGVVFKRWRLSLLSIHCCATVFA